MSLVRPFQAYLPNPELVGAVATPPLGGLTARQWMKLSQDNPHSFLHVIRSEIDSVQGGPDPSIPQSLGRTRLNEMIEEGVLGAGPPDAFYVYGIDDGAHVAVGIVAQVNVDGYVDGRVRRHEHTRQSTEQLLLDHLERVGAQSDPVALTFPADDEIERLIAAARVGEPTLDFVVDDGTHQRVWTIDDPDTVARLQRRLSRSVLYITDGHHRCAAAVRHAERCRSDGAPPGGDQDYFVAVLYPERELTLHEFNRCVADTGMSAAEIVAAVGAVVELEGAVPADAVGSRPVRTGQIGMVLGGQAWRFALPAPEGVGDVASALDVVRLQETVLGPVFDIGDPRTDPRLRYVAGGTPTGPDSLRPESMGCDVCFLMYPTPLEDVMRIADAGLVMPPKSTWFEPKAWGGIFVSLID